MLLLLLEGEELVRRRDDLTGRTPPFGRRERGLGWRCELGRWLWKRARQAKRWREGGGEGGRRGLCAACWSALGLDLRLRLGLDLRLGLRLRAGCCGGVGGGGGGGGGGDGGGGGGVGRRWHMRGMWRGMGWVGWVGGGGGPLEGLFL